MAEVQGKVFQFFVAFIANLMAITDGITVGWTAPMIPYFLSDKSHIKMTSSEAEWMETYMLFGAIAGLPLTAYCVDKIGRKKSLVFSTFVVTLCWIVIALADRIEYIYMARFMNGLGLNMAYIAAPMYVGEISHKDIRGFLSSQVFIMMLIGVLIIYSLGPFVPYYVSSVIAGTLLLIESVVFSFMPETPYYLLSNNKYDEAEKSLKKFRGGSDISIELRDMVKAVEEQKAEEAGRIRDLIMVRNYRKAMVIMFVLNSAQTLSSIEVILMNLHEILENAGSIYIDSSAAAIVFAAIMLIASIASSLTIDKFGRKVLLIISCILTGMCLLTLAIYFNLKTNGYDIKSISWIPIACVMTYAAAFKFGLGMVPIVITAEIFSPKVKAIGMTIADGVYVLASILALQIFHSLKTSIGMHVPFYIFCCVSFLTAIYVRFFIPETKGKTLDEIQLILKETKVNSQSKKS